MRQDEFSLQLAQETAPFLPKMVKPLSNSPVNTKENINNEITALAPFDETLGEEEEKKGGLYTKGKIITKDKTQPSTTVSINSFNNNNVRTSMISSSPTPSTISSLSTDPCSFGGESLNSISWYLAKHYLGFPSSSPSINTDIDVFDLTYANRPKNVDTVDNIAENMQTSQDDDQFTTALSFLTSPQNSNALHGLLGPSLTEHQQKKANSFSSGEHEGNKNDISSNDITTDDVKDVAQLPLLFNRSSSGDDSMSIPLANLVSNQYQSNKIDDTAISGRNRSSSVPSKSSIKSSKTSNAKITKRRSETITSKGSNKIKGRARSASTSSTLTFDSTSTSNGKRCKYEGCIKHSQGNTPFCIAHGGGRRCTVPGCTRGARDQFFCCAHGGGKRCVVEGCTKSAVGPTNKCCVHGGGRRCQFVDSESGKPCDKSAQSSTNYCVRHGGGRKCQISLCDKVARGRIRLCSYHTRDMNEALEDPEWNNDNSEISEKQARIIQTMNAKAALMAKKSNSSDNKKYDGVQASKTIPTRRGSNSTKHKNMNMNTNAHDIVTSVPTISISLANDMNPISNRHLSNGNKMDKEPIQNQSNADMQDENDDINARIAFFFANNSSDMDKFGQNIDLSNYVPPFSYLPKSPNSHDKEFGKNIDSMILNEQNGQNSNNALEDSYIMHEEPINNFASDNINLDYMQPYSAFTGSPLNNRIRENDAGYKNPQDSTLLQLRSMNIGSNLSFHDLSNMNANYSNNIPSPNFLK